MTGRRLYDKYTDALSANARRAYRDGGFHRTYPFTDPVVWPFLSNDERATWNTLARSLQSTRKRAA